MMLAPLHGIASRHDLPLPFGFVVVGAALALVASFAVLIFAWRRPRFISPRSLPLPGVTAILDARPVRMVARVVIVALYGWMALAMMFGKDLLTNPVFGFVFVWMWVGLVPVSVLFGTFWRATNPLRTVHGALCALARIDPDHGLLRLPARVGVWPAAAALFGFGWLELVQPDRTTLAVLRVWALAWFVSMIIGAVLFGRAWIGAADPFEAYATTIARLSPLQRSTTHRSTTRRTSPPLLTSHRFPAERLGPTVFRLGNPLGWLSTWRPSPGVVAVVAALLGSTAYDSFANTSWWIQTTQDAAMPLVWQTGGLLAMTAVVLGSFWLATIWMGRYGDRPAREYPRLMAGSVVPIVLGYAVAHYTTLLVVEGQRVAINLSDPLGLGWDVFGSAEMGVNASIFDHPTAIAGTQLLAIVAGHVLGIIVAHERAVTLLPADCALRGQWPMLAVMVGYTCAGLMLLFSP